VFVPGVEEEEDDEDEAQGVSVISSSTTTAIPTCPEITNLCAQVPSPSDADTPFATIRVPQAQDSSPSFSLSHGAIGQPSIIRPVNLKGAPENYQRRRSDGLVVLSPQQRYALATAVAKAVLYLSNSPWIDDSWTSHHVRLFLRGDPSTSYAALSNYAHIFHAFNMATPHPPLRHRPPATNRFTPNRAIFSLGILLIELAINEAFEETSLDAIVNGDHRKLSRKLDEVQLEAGELYVGAVQRCVSYQPMADSLSVDLGIPKFRQQFHHNIVAPLQVTSEAFARMRATFAT
jgi:hypothetical protein